MAEQGSRWKCEHDWQRDAALEGVLRCTRCGVYGHLRRTPFGTAIRYEGGGINPRKVKPYACSTPRCSGHAVHVLPGLQSHGLRRWACARCAPAPVRGPIPGFRRVPVGAARQAAGW